MAQNNRRTIPLRRVQQRATELFRQLVRNTARKLDHALLDLKKDQPVGILLPGHIKKNLDELRINCVIDVGANGGQYASMLRANGYSGRIVSVEPIPTVYAELQQKAAQDAAWQTLNLALGQTDEVKEFNVYAASDMSSFLSPSAHVASNIDNSHIVKTESVTVKQLDSVFDQIVKDLAEPRVYLKLDTQGYDLEVLKGATRSLSQVLALQSELSVIPLYEGMPDYLEALQFYRDLGFEPTGFYTVATDRQTRHVLELDGVFTRRSSPAVAPASSG